MVSRWSFCMGACLAALAVGLGAYAAHGLESTLVKLGFQAEQDLRTEWFETAVRYQMYHALGMIVASLGTQGSRLGSMAGRASAGFFIGILLFSGGLYAMALGPASWRFLGAVVPWGGLAFIAAWLTLAWSARKCGSNPSSVS